MPDATDPTIDNPDRIDSRCECPPLGTTDTADRCGGESVTFIFRPSGHRAYICMDHARQLLRFGDDVFDGDLHPTVVDCNRCHKPTPTQRVNHDRVCDGCAAG